MEVTQKIKPSPSARMLFAKMVARSNGQGQLDFAQTVKLAVDLNKKSKNKNAALVIELMDEDWIQRAEDGGWILNSRSVRLY